MPKKKQTQKPNQTNTKKKRKTNQQTKKTPLHTKTNKQNLKYKRTNKSEEAIIKISLQGARSFFRQPPRNSN